jgi:hypothetical protein
MELEVQTITLESSPILTQLGVTNNVLHDIAKPILLKRGVEFNERGVSIGIIDGLTRQYLTRSGRFVEITSDGTATYVDDSRVQIDAVRVGIKLALDNAIDSRETTLRKLKRVRKSVT